MRELHKILVVDDNEDFCRNTKDILELKGYEVRWAVDPVQALESVRTERPDLVLMDIHLPIMDGVEAYGRIRETAPHVPTIMMTAYSVEDLIAKALREGAFGALTKPLDFDRMLAIIEKALGNQPLLLIVDDDPHFCASMADVLEHNGYRVDIVHDSERAIAQACACNFDVLLLDLKLPTTGGLETYLAIRDRRPGVRAIFISGYPEEAANAAASAARLGETWCCLSKPVDLDQLLEALQQLRVRQ